MKNIRLFLSEKYQVLEVKLSIYLNRRVFVMAKTEKKSANLHIHLHPSRMCKMKVECKTINHFMDEAFCHKRQRKWLTLAVGIDLYQTVNKQSITDQPVPTTRF